MVRLDVENLSAGYGNKVVISNVSVHYESGQLVCMTGNNGAGKSTLLRTMAVLQPALAGRISIDDCDISLLSAKELSRIVSIVTTGRDIPGNLTAWEIVAMGRSPYTGFFGNLSQADEKIIDNAIYIVGIEKLAGKKTGTLSDGEVQKVLIAKALAQQTPIIIMDEPTAFLDFNSKKALYSLLRRLVDEEDKLIIFSSHDLPLALEYCTDEQSV